LQYEKNKKIFKNVISHAKEYIFRQEIYDGLSAVYDYAKRVELKKNIREYWWKSMVQMNDNIVGLDVNIDASYTVESI
jgi:glycyl-tRNA synthetase